MIIITIIIMITIALLDRCCSRDRILRQIRISGRRGNLKPVESKTRTYHGRVMSGRTASRGPISIFGPVFKVSLDPRGGAKLSAMAADACAGAACPLEARVLCSPELREKGHRTTEHGLFLERKSYVSTLGPVVICPYLYT